MIEVLKKYQLQNKVHHSITSRENHEFCTIFVEITVHTQENQALKIINCWKSSYLQNYL